MVQKACRSIHFVMRIVKIGYKYTKTLPTRHQYVPFSNMAWRARIHTVNFR